MVRRRAEGGQWERQQTGVRESGCDGSKGGRGPHAAPGLASGGHHASVRLGGIRLCLGVRLSACRGGVAGIRLEHSRGLVRAPHPSDELPVVVRDKVRVGSARVDEHVHGRPVGLGGVGHDRDVDVERHTHHAAHLGRRRIDRGPHAASVCAVGDGPDGAEDEVALLEELGEAGVVPRGRVQHLLKARAAIVDPPRHPATLGQHADLSDDAVRLAPLPQRVAHGRGDHCGHGGDTLGHRAPEQPPTPLPPGDVHVPLRRHDGPAFRRGELGELKDGPVVRRRRQRAAVRRRKGRRHAGQMSHPQRRERRLALLGCAAGRVQRDGGAHRHGAAVRAAGLSAHGRDEVGEEGAVAAAGDAAARQRHGREGVETGIGDVHSEPAAHARPADAQAADAQAGAQSRRGHAERREGRQR
mmetsp:Transcript_33789/g.100260  ORF Transcript_33789/g.100260 Transcript_33789/m.100260 type:complete len:413 (-) Transcript_33789:60-1298(-)